MIKLLLIPIKLYQYAISPLFGPRCGFIPSCSSYAEQALRQHGVIKGLYLTSKRLARCHPLSKGGVDPVPPHKGKSHG